MCGLYAQYAGLLTTAAGRLEREAVQGRKDTPAEAAAAEGPGSVPQRAAFAAEAQARRQCGRRARPRPRPARPRRPQRPPAPPRRPLRPLRPAPPAACSTLRLPVPLVVLAVAAGEVSGAHAEAAQHAGAAVPAAARPRGRTCGGGLGVSAARGPLHLRSPRRAEQDRRREAIKLAPC